MKLLYPVYSYVGLPGAKSYEVEVTDSEPENPDGAEPSMYRVWSKASEIMELYDDFPRTGVYWWRGGVVGQIVIVVIIGQRRFHGHSMCRKSHDERDDSYHK